MTKVQIHDAPHASPSAELVRAASAEVVITDAGGRKITLRKPGILAQFKLVRALGPEAAANTTLVSMYAPVLYVTAIDGDAVMPPASEREFEALVQRLDEDGLVAVMTGVQDHFGGGANAEAIKDEARK